MAVRVLTTVWVRSISATTVFFRYLSLAAASVKRNISELAGALAKANYKDEIRRATEFKPHHHTSRGNHST